MGLLNNFYRRVLQFKYYTCDVTPYLSRAAASLSKLLLPATEQGCAVWLPASPMYTQHFCACNAHSIKAQSRRLCAWHGLHFADSTVAKLQQLHPCAESAPSNSHPQQDATSYTCARCADVNAEGCAQTASMQPLHELDTSLSNAYINKRLVSQDKPSRFATLVVRPSSRCDLLSAKHVLLESCIHLIKISFELLHFCLARELCLSCACEAIPALQPHLCVSCQGESHTSKTHVGVHGQICIVNHGRALPI